MIRRGAEASRVATADGPVGPSIALSVDFAREIATTGPIPPYAVDVGSTPGGAGARGLPVRPFRGATLEPVVLAAGATDVETLWAHHVAFLREAPGAFAPTVAYNTNVWDGRGDPPAGVEESIFLTAYESLGSTPYSLANRSIVAREAPLARLAGVDVFVLDDGWQYVSGDWAPHPAKFPGAPAACAIAGLAAPPEGCGDFGPERAVLAAHGLRMGLWMSPLEFNARSRTAATHPHWICLPTGAVAAAVPDQAGFGAWNAWSGYQAHLVDEVARMRREHGATFLKFDFVTWMDCAGSPVTIHEYAAAFRDALAAMRRRVPDVTLQMDETNDNRLFAFESAWFGPSWFLNGGPSVAASLATLASLAPFVPLHGVGVPALNAAALRESDALVGPASLIGHATIWSRLVDVPSERLAAAGEWFRFYRSRADLFAGLTLVLDAPAGAFAFERVRPDLGEAFVAVLDPDERVPPGAPVPVEARLACAGDVRVSNPLGGVLLTVVRPSGDRVRLELPLQDGASAVLLACEDGPETDIHTGPGAWRTGVPHAV